MKKLKEKTGRKMSVRTVVFAAFLTVSLAGTAFGGEPGWASEADGWYYYLSDGSLGTGWIQVDGTYYFLSDTGRCLLDTMTPDGYYVDGSGAWYQRSGQIMGVPAVAPEKFFPISEEWNQSELLAALQYKVKKDFGGVRQVRITSSAIEYVSLNIETTANGKQTGKVQETVLCGIYKEPEQGRYRFDIRINLNRDWEEQRSAAAYDYEMFRALMYQISSVPEILEDAVYSAWQGENKWNINRDGWVNTGDCQVMYTAGNGLGRFFMNPRESE